MKTPMTLSKNLDFLYALSRLKRFGIIVDLSGEISFRSIEQQKAMQKDEETHCFGFYPSLKQKCALELACYQEAQNDYISVGELKFVNEFLELNIQAHDIKIASRFI